jgi:hypothetical protein
MTREARPGKASSMKIVEVGNTYYRRGHENTKRVYTVRVDGHSYEVVASSQRGAELQAERRHEQEMGYLPGRGPRAD